MTLPTKTIGTLAIALVLSGCGNVGREDVFIPYAENRTPVERQTALISTDANANLIRDDVEAEIRRRFDVGPAQNAATAFAEAVTLALIQGDRGQPPSPAFKHTFVDAESCLTKVSPDSNVVHELRTLI